MHMKHSFPACSRLLYSWCSGVHFVIMILSKWSSWSGVGGNPDFPDLDRFGSSEHFRSIVQYLLIDLERQNDYKIRVS